MGLPARRDRSCSSPGRPSSFVTRAVATLMALASLDSPTAERAASAAALVMLLLLGEDHPEGDQPIQDEHEESDNKGELDERRPRLVPAAKPPAGRADGADSRMSLTVGSSSQWLGPDRSVRETYRFENAPA